MKQSIRPVLLWVLVIVPAVRAAETGDVDGDGRLTIADVVHLEDLLGHAEGSLTGFEAFPCYLEQGNDPDRTLWLVNMVPSAIYLESLRRGISGSLAHWDSVWPEDLTAEPLPDDPRCEIELLPSTASGGSNDRARLHFKLTVRAPVRSFSVVLEGPPRLLEAPPGGLGDNMRIPDFSVIHWRRKFEVLGDFTQMHRFGDLPVAVNAQTYLITGGRYVVTYDLLDSDAYDDIEPGEYMVTVEARLAVNTPAGSYPMRILPASQMLFRDGVVRRPIVLANGELSVENEITEGLDDGTPPLRFDRENRRVLGKIEFRLVDGDGNPAEPGEPVVEALNDEEVNVRLQLRTEVPLNEIRYDLRWRTEDGLDLECASPPSVVFARPDGGEYLPWDIGGPGGNTNHCGTIFGIGRTEGLFRLSGADNTRFANNRPDRPLEYFRPLGEWLDIVELRLTVPDEFVGGSEIALTFSPEPGASGRNEAAAFVPYGGLYPCNPQLWPEDKTYWEYNVIYHDSFIRVLGDGEPPPPPDLGIRFVLGTVTGAPGELVEVPIHAASLAPLRRLRLALKLDPALVDVEGVEVDVLDDRTGLFVQERIGRPGTLTYRVCDEENGNIIADSCTFGIPTVAWFRDTDESFILLDLFPSPWRTDGRLVEIGRFLLRIAEDARPGETSLAPAAVPWEENRMEVLVESGGNAEDGDAGGPYSPATEVVEGTVVIEDRGPGIVFVRGDANVDGGIDISDAVLMLSSLFADSGRVLCEDAADADDNGALNITDPILLLGVLFGGEGALPPPSTCGPDPTADRLSCLEGCHLE